MLKKKRVDADADQNDRETRSEIKAEMLGLQRRGQPLPQRLARRMLDRSSEWNRTGSHARKNQSQFLLLRLRSCQSGLEFERHRVRRATRRRECSRWDTNLASEN